MHRVIDEITFRTEYSVNLLDSILESLQLKMAATSEFGEHIEELHGQDVEMNNSDEYVGFYDDFDRRASRFTWRGVWPCKGTREVEIKRSVRVGTTTCVYTARFAHHQEQVDDTRGRHGGSCTTSGS